ncbi:DinB family protein [Pseudooceanicola sp. C21-150M6]|uniref:DinB family protein n=1 Tax=Pseudooceanicola sp. C21-150M6 TaxID=3434355 RepID=UPI003D7F7F8E
MQTLDPQWVRMMARYNRWQNEAMGRAMESLPPAELTKDRGAFFGSILATANHLLWGDTMWISRFDGGPGPGVTAKGGLTLTLTAAVWGAERFRLDGRITAWAEAATAVSLTGTLSWYSGAAKRDIVAPMMLVVTQMFNHQTHHRGQIHAMLTAAGVKTEDTDLFLMPGML